MNHNRVGLSPYSKRKITEKEDRKKKTLAINVLFYSLALFCIGYILGVIIEFSNKT